MKGSNEMDGNLIYAKRLNELDDEIFKISDNFLNTNLDVKDIKSSRNLYDNCLLAINKYKECKTSLRNITPPSMVRVEHQKIVAAIQLFIDGTGAMFNSINIDNLSVGKESMNKGILMQKLGKITVINLSDMIAKKLIG